MRMGEREMEGDGGRWRDGGRASATCSSREVRCLAGCVDGRPLGSSLGSSALSSIGRQIQLAS